MSRPALYRLAAILMALQCSSTASAQDTSLADQKTRADIASTQAGTQKTLSDIAKNQSDIQASLFKNELDTIGSLKGVTEGNTKLTSESASAEALLLGDYALRGAAQNLARDVSAWASPGTKRPSLLLIIGSQRPTVADYLSFKATTRTLSRNLKRAIDNWNSANGHKVTARAHVQTSAFVLPAVAAVASVASLFNVDREISGASISTTDAQIGAIIQAALRRWSIDVDLSGLELDPDPTEVQELLDGLSSDYDEADRLYRDEYLPALKAAGKADSLNPALAAAGNDLQTATGDFRALSDKLFTPVSGVLPASEIQRQMILFNAAATKPLLYIRSYKAAVTTITRKGFLIGRRSTPATMKAAATIDYALLTGAHPAQDKVASAPRLASTYFSTGRVNFDSIDRNVCEGFLLTDSPGGAQEFAKCGPTETDATLSGRAR
jgi:hypothetical protein